MPSDPTTTRFCWAKPRAELVSRKSPVRLAHLFREPVTEQRLTVCSENLDGRAYTVLPRGDDTPRHGRCVEAERTYLLGRVDVDEAPAQEIPVASVDTTGISASDCKPGDGSAPESEPITLSGTEALEPA